MFYNKEMKKVQLMSDLHLDSARIKIDVSASDIVLILGDTTFEDENWYWLFDRLDGKKTIVIPGNHDYDGHDVATRDEEIKDIAKKYENIYYLNNETVVLDGIRFIGSCLWTDFKADEPYLSQKSSMTLAQNIAHLKTIAYNGKRLSIEDIVQLNDKSVKFLEQQLSETSIYPTVVLTHFAPSIQSVSKEYLKGENSYHVVSLDRLMGLSDYWFHGHIHTSCDYIHNGTRVMVNARGNSSQYDLNSNNYFNAQEIIEIQEFNYGKKNTRFN